MPNECPLTTESVYDDLYEQSCITAAERVGPNSPEYEALQERILENLILKFQNRS